MLKMRLLHPNLRKVTYICSPTYQTLKEDLLCAQHSTKPHGSKKYLPALHQAHTEWRSQKCKLVSTALCDKYYDLSLYQVLGGCQVPALGGCQVFLLNCNKEPYTESGK